MSGFEERLSAITVSDDSGSSGSDSDSEEEDESFSPRPPLLSKVISDILTRYSDGQIFKVYII